MITLIDKSPVTAQKHREYMQNARRVDADIVASRIRNSNAKLYMQMGSPVTNNKKLKWDARICQMVFNTRPSNTEAYATTKLYIFKHNGVTYYLQRNGL